MARRKSLLKVLTGQRDEDEADPHHVDDDPGPRIDVQGAPNFAERLLIASVYDCSTSMRELMQELNRSRGQFIADVKSDAVAALGVRVLEIQVQSDARIATPNGWTDAINLDEGVMLQSDGRTALGAGAALALTAILRERDALAELGVKTKTPWIFIMSDGKPNDEFREPFERLRQADANGEVRVFCIAIGDHADAEILRLCCSPQRPVVRIDAVNFAQLFAQMSKSARGGSRAPNGQTDMGPFEWAQQV